MPDTRRHRGPHPEDAAQFAADALPALRDAVHDLSWLLSRGYAEEAARKLVGDRYALTRRQRLAVMRCACADAAREDRAARCRPLEETAQGPLLLDGYNVLTTVEAALGGGVLLLARDGTVRDLASASSTFRQVEETGPALARIGAVLERAGARDVRWLLDRPVGGSGRLRGRIEALAAERGWPWTAALVDGADGALKAAADPIATTDSSVLDRCGPWVNLARRVVDKEVEGAWMLDFEKV